MGLSPSPANRYAVPAVCALLLLAVALVFGQTVRHEFINFDDDDYVYENPQVARGFTAQGIVWAFTHFHSANWHPLTWLSHMLDCQLYGLNHPGGHHLTNVLLHAASAILLFLVLRQMTGDLWPSAFVAALFAIHPLHVESVAWVAERKDVLSGLFFMLTLAAYVGYARRPFSLLRYLLVTALFALGLMAKPMLVTLPFVLLLLDYWPLGRIRGDSSHRRSNKHVRPNRARLALPSRVAGKAALAGAGRRLLRGDAIWPNRQPVIDRQRLPLLLADCQCPGFLRRLSGAVLLSGGAGRVLSPSAKRPARLEDRRLSAVAGRHFPGSPGLPAEVPVSAGRLALVSGNARARDRTGAGRFPGDGRPLHLLDPDRAVYRPGLGSGACFQALALSSPPVWGSRRRWSLPLWRGVPGNRCRIGKTTRLLDAHVGLHFEKLVSPQQPR